MATGPAFQEASGENGRAIVYVYRMPSGELSARDARFYLDGKRVAKLSADGYSYFYTTPGQHKLTQEWPIDVAFGRAVGITLNVTASETHYVRFYTDSSSSYNGMVLAWHIIEVGPAAGRGEIVSRHLQEPDDARP